MGHFYLWTDGPVMEESADALPVSTDSVLLAYFASPFSKKRGLDLGCGSGILSVILAWNSPGLIMDGVEISKKAALLAEHNVALNGLADRVNIIYGDFRQLKESETVAKYNFIITNPPYFPRQSGTISPDPARADARSECSCTLADLAKVSSKLLGTGGRLFMVQKPERLSEIFCVMSVNGLEPKRLRLVEAMPGSAPSLALMEFRRDGKSGLIIEPSLRLKDENGADSKEFKKIYRL